MSPGVNGQAILLEELQRRFAGVTLTPQATKDGLATFWVPREHVHDVLRFLKEGMDRPYRMLYDLTAIDERVRKTRPEQPASDFTVIYHLLSFERNEDIRLKVALTGEYPSLPTITDIWPCANWYEREVWDMFGITF
jgi:NADH-quinone oxidoreductase subunit C/D